MDAHTSIVLDSPSPYYVDFSNKKTVKKKEELWLDNCVGTYAVYMTAEDPLFGEILAIIYQTPTAAESPQSNRLSSIIISRHGTSGFMNMTLSPRSRYYDAVENLAPLHSTSMVRQALAVSLLRSFATMDRSINEILSSEALEHASIYDWDETMAGTLASRMKLIEGKYPDEIGNAVISSGALTAKSINTSILDVVYVDSDTTIEKNNELVYLLGDQLEQLFDPLSEYSPEPTEQLYAPPVAAYPTSKDEPHIQSICQELYTLQANFTADLLEFLQDFLIPLRVKVLGGEIYDLSICKLNMIFPPTIDEIVRINNIFFESLQQSFPFGSFEILKACGTSIPYFYKACMRHEAATKNFFQNLKANFNYFEEHCQSVSFGKYTMRKIESIIHCSLHLTKIKLVIERLFNSPTWSERELPLVKEFYDSAVGTIDAFGKQNTVSSYDRRVFTPTGKVLVELTNGWPKELEYGWINRRVITIFDAVDLLCGDSEKDNHHIVIIFTDHLVILKPNQPIPMKSASGLHVPSVSDVLMHSMVNEVPLQNIPELKVVAWAPIEDVYLSEYNNSRNINIFVTGRGFKTPKDSPARNVYQRLYQLIRPDHVASNLVSLTAKAKVMNKTQPFHLFKSVGPKLSLYTTVHELEGYALEDHKTPIAVFMNVNVTREVLTANNLSACFKVQFHDDVYIRVECFTVFGKKYEFDRLVHCNDFASLINSETAYLFTLHLSTKNPGAVNNIIHANQSLSEFLIDYAKSPTKSQQKNVKPQKSAISLHRRNPIMPAKASLESVEEKQDMEPRQPTPRRKLSPIQIINRLSGNDHDKKETKTFKFLRVRDKSPIVPEVSDMATGVPEMSNSSTNSTAPTTPTLENPHPEEYEFPPKKRAAQEDSGQTPQVHFEAEPVSTRTRRSVSSYNGLWEDTVEDSFSSDALRRHSEVVVVSGDHSVNSESNWVDEDESVVTSTFYGTDDSDDEREQRDVNEWFNNFDLEDSGSLDSIPPEIEPNDSSFGEDDDDVSIRKVTSFFDVETFRSFDNTKNFDESTITSSRILGRMNSSLARIVDTEDAGNVIDGSGESVETLNISEDFGYLAGLVGDADSSSKSSGTDQVPGISYAPVVKSENNGLHEGLRDTSILFLGAYVRSRQDSVANLNIKEEEESDFEEGTTMISGRLSKFSSFRNDLSRTSSFFPLNHQKSQNSLSRMSYGTLQLASLTVEFDRYIAKAMEKIRESREPEMKTSFYQRISNMKLVKRVAMSLYDQTRNALPAHLIPESKKKHMDQEEQERKSKAVKGFMLLASMQISMTGMERDVLLRGYLNLEWQRRNRLEKNSTTT